MHPDPVTLGQVADASATFFNLTLGIAVAVVTGIFWWQSLQVTDQTALVSIDSNRRLANQARRMVLTELRAAEGTLLTVRKLVDLLGVKLVLLIVQSMQNRIPDTELRMELSVSEAGELQASIVGRDADESEVAQ